MESDSRNFHKLKKILDFVWENPYSSFYRDKYKKAGIKSLKNVRSIEDFQKLPYLTREEIVNSDPYSRLFIPWNKAKIVCITSGTTGGEGPMVVFRKSMGSLSAFQKMLDQEILKQKVRSVLLLYSVLPGQHRLSQNIYFQGKRAINVLGDVNNLSLSAKLAAKMQIDAIQTNPTILYYFIEHLKKEYDPDKVKYLMLGGEFCSDQKAGFFKKVFKNAKLNFLFGGAEVGHKGYRCNFLSKTSPRFFHPMLDQYVEIISPEEESELVITHLKKTAFPLIRYRTGDSVQIVNEYCPCGQSQKMEVLGRLEHDVAKIQGTFLYASEIYKALSPFKRYLKVLDYRLYILEEVLNDKILVKLKLQLIPKKESSQRIKLLIARGVSEKLYLSSKHTLSDLVKKGVFLPLDVEFIDLFPIATKQKHINYQLGNSV